MGWRAKLITFLHGRVVNCRLGKGQLPENLYGMLVSPEPYGVDLEDS